MMTQSIYNETELYSKKLTTRQVHIRIHTIYIHYKYLTPPFEQLHFSFLDHHWMIMTDIEKLFLIFRVLGAATSRCYLKKTVPKICFIE